MKVEKVRRPPFTPTGHTKAQRQGLRFQDKVTKALIELYPDWEPLPEPWFRYSLGDQWGLCSPDLLLLPPGGPAYVIEVKLTIRPIAAKAKLLDLYKPVCETYFERPFIPIQVCKRLKKNCGVPQLRKLTELHLCEEYGVIHCPLLK